MIRKISRTTALLMLIIAIAFIVFALSNPQAGFSWNNSITYTIYGVYAALMLVLFIAPFRGQ